MPDGHELVRRKKAPQKPGGHVEWKISSEQGPSTFFRLGLDNIHPPAERRAPPPLARSCGRHGEHLLDNSEIDWRGADELEACDAARDARGDFGSGGGRAGIENPDRLVLKDVALPLD